MRTKNTRALRMARIATFAMAASCSSSGGGGSTDPAAADASPAAKDSAPSSACPGTGAATIGDKCAPCLTMFCNAQQVAYAGPNWATASYADDTGACGDWFMCIGKCGCGDSSCSDKCSMSSACQSAATTVVACTMQNCSNACADMITTSSGTGLCLYESDSPNPCPASGIIGCCKATAQEICFYPPATAATGMLICSDMSAGVWSATP